MRLYVIGFEPGRPGGPQRIAEGRGFGTSHFELIADRKTGLVIGDRIQIRRNQYTVVGLTRRMVSSNGDPMVFVPLKDAQEAQFLKDNDAIVNERARTAANPAFNRPGVPGLLEAAQASATQARSVPRARMAVSDSFGMSACGRRPVSAGAWAVAAGAAGLACGAGVGAGCAPAMPADRLRVAATAAVRSVRVVMGPL